MSREVADGLAVTAMTVRMEVSIHATAGSFALSRQRARRPPRLEREFTSVMGQAGQVQSQPARNTSLK